MLAIFGVRSVLGYLMVRVVIRFRRIFAPSKVSIDFCPGGNLKLIGYSMLIYGIPIESVIRLFLYDSVRYVPAFYVFMGILLTGKL